MHSKTTIDELAALLDTPYQHLELGQVNDHAVYLVRFKGEYVFHRHTKDEMYLVMEGSIELRFKNQPTIRLEPHECTVIRAYTTHSPCAEKEAVVLVFKPKEMFGTPSDEEE